MNHHAIAEAHQLSFTLDVASQISGIPPRLIAALVCPHMRNDTDNYPLAQIERIFSADAGARLLRKLRQNQLCLYRNCEVTWRDRNGTQRVEAGAVVEIRGRRTEVTFGNGYRFTRPLSDPDLRFSGTRVQRFAEPS